MDARVALEILRQRGARDVGDFVAPADFGVQLELLRVVGEHQLAAGRQQRHAAVDERAVVALHIEDVVHALAVRERWRIEENQVVHLPLGHRGLEPGDAVPLHQLVLRTGEPVHRQIALSPIEVGR